MEIAIYDMDGKLPNLALMKIATRYKSYGDDVEHYQQMYDTMYDIVFISSIYTWTVKGIMSEDTICGGTGFDLTTELPDNIDDEEPDYSMYPKFKQSLGFLTRGCIRKCPWCVVPKKEGMIHPYRDIGQIAQTREVILMDNNVLACEYGIKQIAKIARLELKVDFNQGLDARLIDNSIAQLLSTVRWLKPLRMSCDSLDMLDSVIKAVALLRKYGCTPSTYFVYVLVRDIESALTIVEELRKLNLDPFAQPYRTQDGKIPSQEQRDFARWVNHKAIFKTVKWKDYQPRKR